MKKAKKLFEERGGKKISMEEVREGLENLAEFAEIIYEWYKKERTEKIPIIHRLVRILELRSQHVHLTNEKSL